MIQCFDLRRRDPEGRGFTLVELLVVIVILGVLSAVVVFAVRGAGDKGQENATANDERIVRTAMEAFCASYGEYPQNMGELVNGPGDGRPGFLSDGSTYNPDLVGEIAQSRQCGGNTLGGGGDPPATPQWVAQSSGVTLQLHGVDCLDDKTCVAVGDDGAIVRTVDGGTTWSDQESLKTEPGDFAPPDLFGVSCVTVTTCIATGRQSTIVKRELLPDGSPTWTPQRFSATGKPSEDIVALFQVDCPTDTNCFAVGSPPLSPDGSGEQIAPTVIASTDGGTTWVDQVAAGNQILQDVSCLNALSCITSGAFGSILTTQAGGAVPWTPAHTDPTIQYVPGSTCMSVTICLAITDDENPSRRILRSTTGGAPWLPVDFDPGTSALNGVRCADTERCFIVGDGGKIFSSDNAGVTWTTEPVPSGFTKSLFKVSCVAGTTRCWAVGEAGSILVKVS